MPKRSEFCPLDVGGSNSEITEKTTAILLESAYFDPIVVRKGAKALELSTEASRRFERDTDMEAVISSINELAYLLQKVAGGTILNGIIECPFIIFFEH